MKTFDVGQKVWRRGVCGLEEGTVTSFSPKGISMWVTYRDGRRWCYKAPERNDLLTEAEADAIRGRERVAKDWRTALHEYHEAVRKLTSAVDGGQVPGGHMADTIRRVTAQLVAIEQDLVGQPKVQS